MKWHGLFLLKKKNRQKYRKFVEFDLRAVNVKLTKIASCKLAITTNVFNETKCFTLWNIDVLENFIWVLMTPIKSTWKIQSSVKQSWYKIKIKPVQNGMFAQRRFRSPRAPAQSDQSSLWAHWVAKDPSFLHAYSKDSDQTGWMARLIWVFARRNSFCMGRRFTI